MHPSLARARADASSIGCLGASLFDHIGITVDDLPRSIAQFDPVMQARGSTRQDADNGVSWYLGEEELILFAAREPGTGPHRHDRVGWQHLALPVDSRADVDRLHEIAVGAGGSQRTPAVPALQRPLLRLLRQDDNGIRIEFMYNTPRESAAD
jgi:catechol 2,3-dioxygenase-like lactoylglutathione lyase family enzyme